MEYLDESKMSEAEVSLRLAEFLSDQAKSTGPVQVGIDGAQVKIKEKEVFPLSRYMNDLGWSLTDEREWRGRYTKSGFNDIVVHPIPGLGDVVAALTTGQTLRVESKKGPLIKSKSGQELRLVREALGQLLTVSEVSENDILAVSVPLSPKFRELALRWREAPLIKRCGIKIILIGRDGSVSGL